MDRFLQKALDAIRTVQRCPNCNAPMDLHTSEDCTALSSQYTATCTGCGRKVQITSSDNLLGRYCCLTVTTPPTARSGLKE
jgi:hypothetical protein